MMPVRRHLLAGATAVVLVPVLAGCGGGGNSGKQGSAGGDTSLDAIFDNASFVGAGQDVRVAGATVGTVKDVELTRDRKARISMDIDPEFLPFRKDASCTILPQSLIGEKFVECDPGKPSSPALTANGGEPATISLEQTQSPVDLDLVVAMLGQPTNVRTQLLLNEFGAGFATRGKDLDAAIRRSNPFLASTRRTLTVLENDRAALGRIVEASDTMLTELDKRKDDITGTFDGAAEALKPTSQYRQQLDQALVKLPGTLRSLQPALRSLRDLADDAKPTLASLRTSSPALSTLSGDLGPLSDAARPALRRLATASKTGTPILRRALPELQQLQGTTAALAPLSPLFRELSTSLSDNGVPETFNTFVFNVVMATARKDAISHIVPANVIFTPCLLFSETPQPGCEAKFTSEASGNNQLKTSQMKSFLARQKARAAAQPKTTTESRTLLPLAPKEAGR
jgi:virulence factor Mce-like protein